MNRPLYETQQDKIAEARVAKKIADKWGCKPIKLRPTYIVDYALISANGFVSFMEVKCRNYTMSEMDKMGGFMISLDKLAKGIQLARVGKAYFTIAVSAKGVIGLLEDEARELNAPFYFAHEVGGRPFVTLKLAVSADGGVAAGRGKRTRITGPAADREVHRLRAGHDAIGVGIRTALVDDPMLTVRTGRPPRVPPVRVVFDRKVRLPALSNLAATAPLVPTVVVAAARHPRRELALDRKSTRLNSSHRT